MTVLRPDWALLRLLTNFYWLLLEGTLMLIYWRELWVAVGPEP